MNPARLSRLSMHLRRSFPQQVVLHIPSGPESDIAQAARMAGLRVAVLNSPHWPFPELLYQTIPPDIIRSATVDPSDQLYHDKVRDWVASTMKARPGGAAITEVPLVSTSGSARAIADIVAAAPVYPKAATHIFTEVKTGSHADLNPGQQYVYALALIGEHVITSKEEIRNLGLAPLIPLPPMDFMFVSVEPPAWRFEPAIIFASQVNTSMSIAQIQAFVAGVESAP